MSLCKQARAPARGGGLLGSGRPRVPLNGCRKTKPFESASWKRETTVGGTAEKQSELHLTDRELWFELRYWPRKKDSENVLLAKQRPNNLRHPRRKRNMHFQSVLDYGLPLFRPALLDAPRFPYKPSNAIYCRNNDAQQIRVLMLRSPPLMHYDSINIHGAYITSTLTTFLDANCSSTWSQLWWGETETLLISTFWTLESWQVSNSNKKSEILSLSAGV